jgi:small subunit ribosomal protein S14
MAKTSMILRDVKRKKIAKQYEEKRESLRTASKDASLDYDAKWEVMIALQKLPRDSSKSRQRNRCALTGRPHGYFRKFGLSRNRLREIAMRGEAPGVTKASW